MEVHFDVDSQGHAQNLTFAGPSALQDRLQLVFDQLTFPLRRFGARHYVRFEFKLAASSKEPLGEVNKVIPTDTYEIKYVNFDGLTI